ncbi:unnamed protein product, partial [Heterotrigona itama]
MNKNPLAAISGCRSGLRSQFLFQFLENSTSATNLPLLARLEIYHGPESDLTVSFIHSPARNFLPPFSSSQNAINFSSTLLEELPTVAPPTILLKGRRNAKAARIFHTTVRHIVLRIFFFSTVLDAIDFLLFQRDLGAVM